MAAIDALNLATRTPVVALEAPQIRLDIAAAQELGLRAGEVVKGVVEFEGDVARFVLEFNGKLVKLPLKGGHLVAGKAAFSILSVDSNEITLKPLAAAPEAAPGLKTQFISDSLTAMSLALRPQDLAAVARFMLPVNLDTLFQRPEMTGVLMPFMRQRLNTRELAPVSIKSAFETSGLWAEARLAARQMLSPGDFKVALWRLLERASDGSGADFEELDEIKGALGALESAQIQAVQAQAQGELFLSIVIPFMHENPLHLSLQRAAVSDAQPSPPFVINAYSNDDVLGEIWLKSVIEKQGELEIIMWAKNEATAKTAATASSVLTAQLSEFGLSLRKISIINGARSEAVFLPPEAGQMVNIQI